MMLWFFKKSGNKYFSQREFDSPDLAGSGRAMQKSTLKMLYKTRALANIPFIITSGFRTVAHNLSVGGVNSSSHLKGYAIDIQCNNSSDRFKIIKAALDSGFNRIGVDNKFIHLDNDPIKAKNVVWTY